VYLLWYPLANWLPRSGDHCHPLEVKILVQLIVTPGGKEDILRHSSMVERMVERLNSHNLVWVARLTRREVGIEVLRRV
jgi:hypothetical protein